MQNEHGNPRAAYQPKLLTASSAVAIPAHSCCRISDLSDRIVTVAQPNADNIFDIFVNPQPIAANKKGAVSRDWPLLVKYAGGDPTVGRSVGATNAAWTMKKENVGFRVLAVDSANSLVLVEPEKQTKLCKLQEDIAAGGSGDVKEVDRDDNYPTGAETYDAKNVGIAGADEDDKALVSWDVDGEPFFVHRGAAIYTASRFDWLKKVISGGGAPSYSALRSQAYIFSGFESTSKVSQNTNEWLCSLVFGIDGSNNTVPIAPGATFIIDMDGRYVNSGGDGLIDAAFPLYAEKSDGSAAWTGTQAYMTAFIAGPTRRNLV